MPEKLSCVFIRLDMFNFVCIPMVNHWTFFIFSLFLISEFLVFVRNDLSSCSNLKNKVKK